MKKWNSPIYMFFKTVPEIRYDEDNRRYHLFRCAHQNCNKKIQRYLDKKDARSTGNLRKHARSCWGRPAVEAADKMKNVAEARKQLISNGILRDGSITAAFERSGEGKVTYSHRAHTKAESR